MEPYKAKFIEFMVRSNVLVFGDFTAKSGRKTPYFVNTGKYRTGNQLRILAGFYADAIQRHFGTGFDVLFGPAYKGIPLAAATAMALAERGQDVGFAFNRKEVKDHGEGGNLVGMDVSGARVLIIEDVTTAGTSIRETVPILKAAGSPKLAGLIVSVDRQEKGTSTMSALSEVGRSFDMKTASIVTVDEIVEHLREHPVDGKSVIDDDTYDRIVQYRRQYGGQ